MVDPLGIFPFPGRGFCVVGIYGLLVVFSRRKGVDPVVDF